MTEKLYDVNAYLTEFDAAVVSCQVLKEGTERDVNSQLAVGEAARPDAPLWEVVLDRTAFYPEGGGQPCDFGVLGGARVTDVQEKGGIIFHLCSAPLEVGSCVHGTIDWDRRLMHMREHSGEHIISGIICHTHGYSNIGFHMGKDCVTIDFSGTADGRTDSGGGRPGEPEGTGEYRNSGGVSGQGDPCITGLPQ